MPAVSISQQQFAGAELAKRRKGMATKSKMSTKQLQEFAATKHKGLPKKKGKKAPKKPMSKY